MALDIETTGLNPALDSILMVGVDEFIFERPMLAAAMVGLRPLLESNRTVKIIHNAAFEGTFFLTRGIRLRRVVDTLIGAALLKCGLPTERGTLSLGNLLEKCLGVRHDKALQTSFIGADPMVFRSTPEQQAYLYRDIKHLRDLAAWEGERLREQGMAHIWRIENAFTQVIASIQTHGAPFDWDAYAPSLDEAEAEFTRLEAQVSELLTPSILEVRRRKYEAARELQYAWATQYDQVTADIEKMVDEEPEQTRAERRRRIQMLQGAYRAECPRPATPKMDTSPIKVTSTQQISAALAELGLVLPDTKRDTLLRAKATCDPALHPILDGLAELSVVEKQLSGYGRSLRERISPDGRLRPAIHQLMATGRVSSAKWKDDYRNQEWGWNSQNAHPKAKACVVPPAGRVFVIADYSQIELRVAAELILREYSTADDALVRAFVEGLDPHSATAAKVTGESYAAFLSRYQAGDETADKMRKAGKTTNFSTLFFISPDSLALRIYAARKDTHAFGPDDVEAAKQMIAAFWAVNPHLKPLLDEYGQMALKQQYTETLGGRRRYYPKLQPRTAEWHALAGGIKRKAANHPIQGSAADIAKLAGVLIVDRLPKGAFLWNAVHDEVCVECDADQATAVTEIVRNACLEAYSTFIHHVPGDVACGAHGSWTH